MLLYKVFLLISLLGQFVFRFLCENALPLKHSHILPNISNAHYSLFGIHDSSLSLSRSNRCLFYPRCLLFSCCDKSLLERTSIYFHGDGSLPIHFSCMKTGKCLYSSPLAERLRNLDIINTTLTVDLLADLLLILPPTSPRVYKELAARKEFKVLYLTQGDYFSKLESCLHQFQDMIFLSYKEKVEGHLYFPSAKFAHGRMALYLVARLLEIQQGWLYNYFVFTDDDADFAHGNVKNYESFLQLWQPAIGVPGYVNRYPHTMMVESISHFDFIVIGYHREAVEVLHPWIVELDDKCIWASELYQTLEASLLYRNHVLAFKDLVIWNGKHRHRPARACGEVFESVFKDMNQSTSPALRHCFITDSASYLQGGISGEARRKNHTASGVTYHMMRHGRAGRTPSTYVTLTQEHFSCSDTQRWNRTDPRCCSLDSFFLWQLQSDIQ